MTDILIRREMRDTDRQRQGHVRTARKKAIYKPREEALKENRGCKEVISLNSHSVYGTFMWWP